ncbi:MAG: apolipoprotein N-acyltransferase, partial [Propionibacteriaceae bacterium]|nr:apolipoprotein N-acyltransferase [Propionibacteriaceae bacterium]
VTGVALLVAGAGGLLARGYNPPADGRTVTVAVVQGNVPGAGIDALGPRYTVENNHLAETIILAARIRAGEVAQPDFVVWPENSTATDPLTDQKTAGLIATALDLAGVPVLVGAIVDGPGADERQTVGLWWTADGITARYNKRNLVPFGEWVPLRSLLTKLVPDLQYVGRQSVPGTTPGVLGVEVAGEPLRLGDLICFEVAYDDTVDEMLRGDDSTGGGAQVVAVQTSNAMFTGTDQMAQQDRITRIRALEAHREILVATTNSLAGLIDARGTIVYEASLRTADAQVFTVPARTTLTPAIAGRGWIDLASVVLPLVAGAGVGVVTRRRGIMDQPH